MTHYEIVRTDAGFHARLRAANGHIVMSSEVYARRGGALNAIVVAFEAAGCSMNRPPTKDDVPGRYLGTPIFGTDSVSFEIRDLDLREAPIALVIDWPVFHTQANGQDFWHDRDTHWRHCFDSDCVEAIPPVGVSVRCRLGDVVVTKALHAKAAE